MYLVIANLSIGRITCWLYCPDVPLAGVPFPWVGPIGWRSLSFAFGAIGRNMTCIAAIVTNCLFFSLAL